MAEQPERNVSDVSDVTGSREYIFPVDIADRLDTIIDGLATANKRTRRVERKVARLGSFIFLALFAFAWIILSAIAAAAQGKMS